MRWLLAFAIVIVVAQARAAWARSCVPPSSSTAFVSLSDRDLVPANLVLFSSEVTIDEPDIVATSSDGNDVVVFSAVDVDGMFRFERERDLLPDTEYALCASGFAGVCQTRRTSTTTDDEAPPAPTAAITDVHGLLRLERGCDGEGVDATMVVVEGEIAGDTATAVLRRSVNGGDDVVADVQNLALRQNVIGLIDAAEQGGDALYSVAAIDLAGNESEPTLLQQSLGCPGSCAQADAMPLACAFAAFTARAWRRRR